MQCNIGGGVGCPEQENMSFSTDVKKELTLTEPGKKCCQLAQITGFLRLAGTITLGIGGMGVKISTENPAVARAFAQQVKSYFGTRAALSVEESALARGRSYELSITPDMNADAILRETGILSVKEGSNYITDGISSEITRKRCCKKAALRGAFLAAGSVSAPTSKGYHLEISCSSPAMGEDVQKLMAAYGLKAKLSERKGRFVVYLKDGDQIADFLGLIGANSGMFSYQDTRITREMKNEANRLNNCEIANLDKTIAAAQKQIADIRKIEEKRGLDFLPLKLRQTAELRLENPELPLTELAELFDPPLKKSGLNHRFEKIAEIAKKLI